MQVHPWVRNPHKSLEKLQGCQQGFKDCQMDLAFFDFAESPRFGLPKAAIPSRGIFENGLRGAVTPNRSRTTSLPVMCPPMCQDFRGISHAGFGGMISKLSLRSSRK